MRVPARSSRDACFETTSSDNKRKAYPPSFGIPADCDIMTDEADDSPVLSVKDRLKAFQADSNGPPKLPARKPSYTDLPRRDLPAARQRWYYAKRVELQSVSSACNRNFGRPGEPVNRLAIRRNDTKRTGELPCYRCLLSRAAIRKSSKLRRQYPFPGVCRSRSLLLLNCMY